MKPQTFPLAPKLIALVIILAIPAIFTTHAQVIVNIPNSTFDSGGGQINSQFSLAVGTSTAPAQQIGTSGWYGIANATNLVVGVPVAGFRPGIEVDNDASSVDVAEIRYNLGASLGGLAGLEMPEADLWRPLTGQNLQPNRTYTFSVDVDAGAVLDISALTSRGFGIAVTTGATTSSMGTFFADSLSNPSFASINVLSGNLQRLNLTFTTGAAPASGTIGVVIFAGRGTQQLQLNLLSDIDIDNASLSSIPEPNSAIMFGLGLGLLLTGRRLRRTFTKNDPR